MTESFRDLLPCPFCGESSISISSLDDEDDRRYWFCVVECNNCDANIKQGIGWDAYCMLGDNAESYVKNRCVVAWNTRHVSQQDLESRKTLLQIEQQLDQILSTDTNQVKLNAQQWAIDNPEAALKYLRDLEDS